MRQLGLVATNALESYICNLVIAFLAKHHLLVIPASVLLAIL